MALPASPHRARLPEPPADDPFLRELVAAIQRELDLRIPTNMARADVLLLAPNGTTWALTVADDGSLHTSVRARGGADAKLP